MKAILSDPERTLVAVGFAGCPGAPTVIGMLALDSAPNPTAFSAATLKRYVFPFAKPASTSVVFGKLNSVACCAANPMYGVTT